MPYGTLLSDTVQSSTAGTPPQFNDGNGTQTGTLCRAWVNFNGTTSPGTIRASFNVASVTKNGTGDYTLNFTIALADANYTPVGMVGQLVPTNSIRGVCISTNATPTTSALRVSNVNTSAVAEDLPYYCIAIFR